MDERPPTLPFPDPEEAINSPMARANDLFYEERSFGQRAADAVTEFVGSWHFIIVQSILIGVWVALNTAALIHHWDPYPFIFMNLLVSLESAIASPMILMSQKRQLERDRAVAQKELAITIRAEAEVRAILAHLAAQDRAIAELRDLLLAREGGPPPPKATSPAIDAGPGPPPQAGGGG